MKYFVLLFSLIILFSLPLLINDIDAQRYHGIQNKPITDFEDTNAFKYELETPDLYVSDYDCTQNKVAVATQWVIWDKRRSLEVGITAGSFNAPYFGASGRECYNEPIIYYGYRFVNASGLPDYREFKVSGVDIGSLKSFMLEDMDDNNYWEVFAGDLEGFADANLQILNQRPSFYQIGSESQINPVMDYSSNSNTHFKNYQMHKDGSFTPISTLSPQIPTGNFGFDSCNSQHFVSGNVLDLDCNQSTTQNTPPQILTPTITDINSRTKRITITTNDADSDYLKFYVDPPSHGRILGHSTYTDPLQTSTHNSVTFDYYSLTKQQENLNIRVTDGRQNHETSTTISLFSEPSQTTQINFDFAVDSSAQNKIIVTFDQPLRLADDISNWRLSATVNPTYNVVITDVTTFDVASRFLYVFHEDLPDGASSVSLEYVGGNLSSEDSTYQLQPGTKDTIPVSNNGNTTPGNISTEFYEDFEDTLSGWNKSGNDRWQLQGISIRVPGLVMDNTPLYSTSCNPQCVITMIDSVDLTQTVNQKLTLWKLLASGVQNSEFARIDYSVNGGSAWDTLDTFSQSNGDSNWRWSNESYDLTPYSSSTQFKIRLIVYTISGGDIILFDEIKISGDTSDNTPPQITITAPNDGQIFTIPDVVVSGTVNDPESEITRVTLQLDEQSQITASAQYSHTFTNLTDGSHIIQIDATNSQGLSSHSFLVFVINSNPVANAGIDQTVTENSIILLDGTASTDPENRTLSYRWTQTDNSGLSITLSDVATPRFVAPQVDSDTALDFELTVNNGISNSPPDAVSIIVQNITPVNHPPQIQNMTVNTAEDTSVLITISGYDEDEDSLEFVLDTPSYGVLTGFSVINSTSSQVSYTSNENFFGIDSFLYHSTDGTIHSNNGTISIQITPVNDPPVAIQDNFDVIEDTPIILNVLSNDYDVDSLSEDTNDNDSDIAGFVNNQGTFVAYYDTMADIPNLIIPESADLQTTDDTTDRTILSYQNELESAKDKIKKQKQTISYTKELFSDAKKKFKSNDITKKQFKENKESYKDKIKEQKKALKNLKDDKNRLKEIISKLVSQRDITSSSAPPTNQELKQIKQEFKKQKSEFKNIKESFKEQKEQFADEKKEFKKKQKQFQKSKSDYKSGLITKEEFQINQSEFKNIKETFSEKKESFQNEKQEFKKAKASLKISKQIKKLFSDAHNSQKIAIQLTLNKNYTDSEILRNIIKDNTNTGIAHLTESQLTILSESGVVSDAILPHTPELYNMGAEPSLANLLHAKGITGHSITVAVIDDSFILSDGTIESNVSYSTLHDSSGRCDGVISCGKVHGNSHGTAVSGIITQLAPDVSLEVYAISNSIDFTNTINHIISRGEADVISISLGFPTLGGDGTTGYFRDGTSSVAKAVNRANDAGILVVSAAGNDAKRHWSGTYHSSSISPSSIGLSSYDSVHEFAPDSLGLLRACLPINSGAYAILSWNEWPYTTQDYDLFLYDSTMTSLYSYSARNHQAISLSPIELIQSGAQGCLVVASSSTTQNHHLHIYTLGGSINDGFAISEGSISTPADAIHSITAGAIHYSGGTIEPFSSYGPTDDGREKPDICGFDGVSSGQELINPFYGTSAATPHISGGIALFLDAYPNDANIIDAITADSQYENECNSRIISLDGIAAQYTGSDPGSKNTENTTRQKQTTKSSPGSTSSSSAITISSVDSPANGDTTLNHDGTITYSPYLNHYGTDSFTYTITDGSLNNTGTVTLNVIGVNDPPTLNPISDYTINEDSAGTINISSIDPEDPPILSAVLPGFATILDNSDGTGTISLEPGFSDAGTYSISVTATDADDTTLSQTENFVLSVNNTNRAPAISPINNITIPMIELYSFTIQASDPDGDEISFSTSGLPAGAAINGSTGLFSWAPSEIQIGEFAFRVMVTERDTTISDYIIMQITVFDSVPPVITPPNDITFEATAIQTPLDTTHYGVAAATDNIDQDITITNNAVSPFVVGTHTITWSATDNSGNLSTATQTITVQDTTPPVIIPPNDLTIEATAIQTPLELDNYGTATASDIFEIIISDNAPDLFPLGDTIVIWSGTDANGNTATTIQNIILQDTTPPVIDIVGQSQLIQEYGIEYTDAGAISTDAIHGNLAGTIKTQNPVDTFIVGNYTITYSVTDYSNNNISATRNVTVSDTQAPVLLLIGESSVPVEYGSDYVDAGATAADPVDGDISGRVITTNTVDTRILDNYTVTYHVSDRHQNQADSIIRNVTVQDTIPPIINIGNYVVTLERGVSYQNSVTATDPVDGDLTNFITTSDTINIDTPGNYTILYDVIDINGNKAEQQSVTILVQDTIPPTADAGYDVITLELSIILLDGTASHDGSYPVSYQWRQTSGIPLIIQNATSSTPTITIPKTDTSQIIPFEVIVSDGTNHSTDIVNLNIQTKPRIVLSTELYKDGTISQMSNATYTITPHPYTGNNSMIIHQEMINDSQYPLELLDASYTDTNLFKQLYYAGDLAVDDVLPGIYDVTISKYGTAKLLADSVTLYAENSHVSVASFVSYDGVIGDIVQAISVPPPDINTNSNSSITKLHMTVGNNTMSSLPPIIITSDASQVSSKTIMVSAGLDKITDKTIPRGSDIIQSLSIPTYNLPKISNVISVLPPISISDDNTNLIMSPPVKSWVTKQQIVIPISDVTQNNIVSEIRFSSSESSNRATSEWLGVQLDNSIPESLPALPNSYDSLFLDIKYPHEEGLDGIDWSKPENHHTTPQITINVAKPDSGYIMEKNSSGCAIYDIYLYEDNSWNQNSGASITSNEPIDSDTCRMVISFEHFSSYGLSPVSGSSSSSVLSSSSSSSGSSSGGGRTGVNTDSISPSFEITKPENIPTQKDLIPSWVKSTAGLWGNGDVDQNGFLAGIQYMMEADIIDVNTHGAISEVPVWLKNIALWWSEGIITDEEFTNSISHLIQRGILS